MPRIVLVGAGSVEFTRNLLGDILTSPALRDVADRAPRHRPRAARDRGADGPLDGRRAGCRRRRICGPPRPARGARRRGLRRQHDPGRRRAGDRRSTSTCRPVRAALHDRRHDRRRRRVPGRCGRSPSCWGSPATWRTICPDAWLLNYTNPLAIARAGGLGGERRSGSSGLCHSVFWTIDRLAGYLGAAARRGRRRDARA